MSGDYTRFTHRPERDYSSVLMQQGRVQLDSDWNEQSDILQRRLRVQAMDTFGPSAVPEPTTPNAFKLTALAGSPVDLSIGSGRLYLDGLLAEMYPGESFTYRNQKYYPDPVAVPTSGEAIAFLDVWEREITYIEDQDLLEKALGGPDTTTRRQTVWQVKLREVAGAQCGTDLNALVPPSAGRVTTSAIAPPPSNDPCILPPSGGYRGLDNRLYRVEVHTPGALGTARFKWSRDNASIVSRVDGLAVSGSHTVLTVARIGRDEVLRFSIGDWVEVTDIYRELMGEPGEMAQVTDTDETALTITLDRTIPSGSGRAFGATAADIRARHTRVRRWDERSPGNTIDANGLMTIDGTNTHLEDGVFVQFSLDPAGGEFKVGDYWVFAARTADASVEPLTAAPPRGIVHHYTQLATLEWQGSPLVLDVDDCRTLWPDPNCCTISVRPGASIQRAIDALPAEGGCVCLLPGIHEIERPVLIDARKNITIEGLGRASKVITDPDIAGGAAFYIAGGSHHICLFHFLVLCDDRATAVTVAEDTHYVGLFGMTLIDSAPGESCGLLLAGCSDVAIAESTFVGRVGVLQADPARLADVAAALAALRPPVPPNNNEEFPTVPEPLPLRELTVATSELFVTHAAIDLQNVVGGHVRENVVSGLDPESLPGWRRSGSATEAPDLHVWLDDALGGLVPVQDVEFLDDNASGLIGGLLEDFDFSRNHVAANQSVAVLFARRLSVEGNRLLAGSGAVRLGYAFDCSIRGNLIVVSADSFKPAPADTLREAIASRVRTGKLGVTLRFARGLDIEANEITAPSGIGISLGTLVMTAIAGYPQSLVRLLRIGRVWHVIVELFWLLLNIVRALMAATGSTATLAASVVTKDDLEARLHQALRSTLANSGLLPAFVGKARIADNRFQVASFGVFLYQIFSIGGLRITGNRVSGFTRAAISVHPLFSIGFADRFASWVRCAVLWLIALLTLLRDRLALMIQGQQVTEPQQPAEVNAGTVAATSVGWLLYFCSRFCGGGHAPGDTGPGTEEESPAQELEDALDDLLEHLNPAWIEDLVTQSYAIEDNTLRGSGDGIVTGIDSTQILNNRVDIELGNTLAMETLTLGLALQRRFGTTVFANSLLFGALMEVDRDLFLLAVAQSSWVDPHVNDASFRTMLLQTVQEVGAVASPDSAIMPHLTALNTALTAVPADTAAVQEHWNLMLLTIWTELRGYGIVMQGADMVCSGSTVRALRGCTPFRRRRFGATDPSSSGSVFALPGVLPAVPALGGIWQFTNLGGWLEDLLAIVLGSRSDRRNYYGYVVWGFVLYLALSQVRNRKLCVGRNIIEEAIAFGVRTLQAGGEAETDIVDNFVRDAVRYGICHRGHGLGIGRDDDGMHTKVHRNSVVRTSGVFQPQMETQVAAPFADFASLIWLDNEGGRTVAGSNHGDGDRLESQRRALRVLASIAGVTDNHIQATSTVACEVFAGNGLFTSNMTHPGNDVTGGLRQPPNVETL